MRIDDFILMVKEQFEGEVSLTPETIFHDLDLWDSMTAIAVVQVIKERLGRTVNLNDMRSCKTIRDLFALAQGESLRTGENKNGAVSINFTTYGDYKKGNVVCAKDDFKFNDIPGMMVGALYNNPFLANNDCVFQCVGVKDGIIIGGNYNIPMLIRKHGEEIRTLISSGTFVAEAHRNTGFGLDLWDYCLAKSPDRVVSAAGCSQMKVRISESTGCTVFRMPRYIMLWKSRSVVSMKLKGWLCNLVTGLIDCVINAYAVTINAIVKIVLLGYRVEKVRIDDESAIGEVADIIATDTSLYSELHDARWLKWHLTNAFSKDGPLQMLVAKCGCNIVGFSMIKKRFHEQASHRGFKNVWLGSIVEWQMRKGYEKKLGWLIVLAALELKKYGMDAVELPSADKSLNRFVHNIGWKQVGESNFVIKVGDGSPLFGDMEIQKADNWRLRPAMGDAGLS